MKKPSDDYEVIATGDGSYTLFSKKYNEACHSKAGAIEETKLHYLKACELEDKIKTQERVSILEVGFGTGLGYQETYKLFESHDSLSKLDFVSFEIDPILVESYYARHANPIGLTVLVGDARQRVKDISQKFDAIFQDAFSPRRNPELWTVEWFQQLARLSSEHTILSTYSASTRIRKSLIEADWKLYPGAMFGDKKSATIARRIGEGDPEIIDKLSRSSVSGLTDEQVEEYRKIY